MLDGYQVESCLFKVHRHFFEISPFFAYQFELAVNGAALGGSSDEHPMVLKGITADDFRRFLTVMLQRFTFGKLINSNK